MKERVINFLVKNFLDCIFPVYCLNCKVEGEWICQKCRKDIRFWNIGKCPYCQSFERCECNKNFIINEIFVGCNYDENFVIKKALQVFKYNYVFGLADLLADLFFYQDSPCFKDIDYISPVPLHKKRQNTRGFNQAELLAKALSEKIKIPLALDLVIRNKNTKQQAKLNLNERKENVSNAFFCQNKEKTKGKNILIVDDVLTTGSTLNECAAALKNGGAGDVRAWVVAKG